MASLEERVSNVTLTEGRPSTPLSPAFIARRKEMYNELVADFPTSYGKSVSKTDRSSMVAPPSSLCYGEIDFDSFGVAFEKVRRLYGVPGNGSTPIDGPGILQNPGGKFYDIGSGTGKPSVAAAFLHPFELVAGVEILPGLHGVSIALAELFETKGRALLEKEVASCLASSASASEEAPKDTELVPKTAIGFTLGDATDLEGSLDWSDGDLIFANSTCFDDALMDSVASAAQRLRKGTIFITLTRRIPSANFTVLEQKIYKMSWGGATVFIHQKLTDPGQDVKPGPPVDRFGEKALAID